jgi:hypothetical protein
MNQLSSRRSSKNLRIRIGLVIAILGMLVFTLGVQPGLFGLDRSPVVGFVQIAVFLTGLAMICLGGYIVLNALWIGRQKTISADIGFRLIATGYLIAAVSGMADVFGFGSQPFPNIPYFGLWQAIGVMLGQIMIVIGFILLIPSTQRHGTPSDQIHS